MIELKKCESELENIRNEVKKNNGMNETEKEKCKLIVSRAIGIITRLKESNVVQNPDEMKVVEIAMTIWEKLSKTFLLQ